MLEKMKYAIYGVNRVAKDFLYMFDDLLEISCFFEDEITNSQFMNRRVYQIDRFAEYQNDYQKIILCDFDKKEKIDKLTSLGMLPDKDYIEEKSFFYLLDDKEINPKHKKNVVWGTGIRARQFIQEHLECEISFFIDTYKKEDTFYNRHVLTPEEVEDWNDIFVIVAIAKADDVIDILRQKGMGEGTDFCQSVLLDNQPSQMLEKTIFEQSQYDLECKTMENHAEVLAAGNVFCCCSTLIDRPIGNIRDCTFESVWNSNIHKVMCLSIENGTYSFCKKNMCPFFIGRKTEKVELNDTPYYYMDEMPKVAAVGFDETCNLKCETCRDKIKASTGEIRERNLQMAERVNSELLANSQFFIMAGDGEVFASPVYKKIYQSDNMNNIPAIRILSNGTLFNEKNWAEFSKDKIGKILLTVSVDAATKSTYEKIRRGGNFDILKQNMEFASKLRKEGKLSYFRMNFVVQRRNYKEMVSFVEWGLRLGCDEVFFTKILNWGTYTDEQFKEVSMMEEDGVTPKKELEEVLNNSVMKNKIVDLGTIRYAHEPVKENVIENYYMWELERKVEGLFGEEKK